MYSYMSMSTAEDRDVGLKREDAIKNSQKKEEKNRGGLKLATLPRMNEPSRAETVGVENTCRMRI